MNKQTSPTIESPEARAAIWQTLIHQTEQGIILRGLNWARSKDAKMGEQYRKEILDYAGRLNTYKGKLAEIEAEQS